MTATNARRVPRAARRDRINANIIAIAVVLLLAALLAMTSARGPAPGAAMSALPRAAGGATGNAVASDSRIFERSFYAPEIGRWMPYTIYLPGGYDGTRQYPVLYMLHGLGGDHVIEWRAYGIFQRADELIRSGTIAPLIIVLPEGEGAYWVDHAGGGPRWASYVAHDLVAEVDAAFRTLRQRGARAVGGNSMGAHGALQLMMNYPDVFGVVGVHSPVLRGRDTLPGYFGDQAYFEAHDPVTLLRGHPEVARGARIWVDAGAEDPWLPAVSILHEELATAAVPHDFRVLPGPHDDEYWTAHLRLYLEFYSSAFDRTPNGP